VVLEGTMNTEGKRILLPGTKKDPMAPAKIRGHEPPAVKGEMSEEITEQSGQAGKILRRHQKEIEEME
jgi:hypothetical protein